MIRAYLTTAGLDGTHHLYSIKILGWDQVSRTTTPPQNTLPNAPINLYASASGTSVILTWTDASINESGFKIERKLSSGGVFEQIGTVAANTVTYTDTGLALLTGYSYRVCAYNSAGPSAYSNTASTTTGNAAPNAPSSLSATPTSTTTVTLSWTLNGTNATGTKVERKTGSGGTYTQVGLAASGVSTYSDSGLSASTVYYYRVRAYNAIGNSNYSNEASCTTPAVHDTIPAAPSGLTATAASSSVINLSWTDNSTNELGFIILRKAGAGGSYMEVASTSASSSTYSDTGLSPSTTYYYTVYAYNGVGNSDTCTEAYATTSAAVPSAPTNVSLSGITTISFTLTWSETDTSVTLFTIQRYTGAGAFTTIATVEYPTMVYLDKPLTPSTTYYYRIKATNTAGDSDWSATIQGTTETSTPHSVPDAPTNLSATTISSASIGLTWTASAGAYGYKIERQAGTEYNYTQIATTDSNVTAYTDTGLAGSTLYYYRVRAYNSIGNSDYSDPDSATTDANVPAAPSNLLAVAASTSAINLTWTDNATDETGFTLQRKSSGSYSEIDTPDADATAYADSGLTENTTYTYRIAAVNAVGDSAWSNEASAKTAASTGETVPDAPSDLTAQAVSTSAIILNWTDNSSNESDFVIYRKTDSDDYIQTATVNAGSDSYTDTGLDGGTTYYYKVAAQNSTGTSAFCDEAYATTYDSPPNSPTHLLAVTKSATEIDLTWVPSTSSTDSQAIRWGTSLTGTWLGLSVASDTSSSEMTDLNPDTQYYFRVFATNGAGDSAPSNTASARTDPLVIPPPPDIPASKLPDSFGYPKPAFAPVGALLFWTTQDRKLRKFDGRDWYYFGIKDQQSWYQWEPTLSLIKKMDIYCSGNLDASELDNLYQYTKFTPVKCESSAAVEVNDVFWRRGAPGLVTKVDTNIDPNNLTQKVVFDVTDFDSSHLLTSYDETWDSDDLYYFSSGNALYDGAGTTNREGNLDGKYQYRLTFTTKHDYETNWCQTKEISCKKQQVKISMKDFPYYAWYMKYLNIYRTFGDAPGVFYLVDSIPIGSVAGTLYEDTKWNKMAVDDDITTYQLANNLNSHWSYDQGSIWEVERVRFWIADSSPSGITECKAYQKQWNDAQTETPDIAALVLRKAIPGSSYTMEFAYDWLQQRTIPDIDGSCVSEGIAFGFDLDDPWVNADRALRACKDSYHFCIYYDSVNSTWMWDLSYYSGTNGDLSPINIASDAFDLAPISGADSFDPGLDNLGNQLPLWYSDRRTWRIRFNGSTGEVWISYILDGVETQVSYSESVYTSVHNTVALLLALWKAPWDHVNPIINGTRADDPPDYFGQYRFFRAYTDGFVYYDNKPDEELGSMLHDWKLIPEGADDLCSVRDCLAVAYGNQLYLSEPGDPETVYFEKLFEQPIMAIDSVSNFDDVVVFLRNKIYRMNIDDKSTVLVSEKYGALGKNAVVNVGGRLVFMSHGGMYQYDGANIGELDSLWKVRDLFLGRAKRHINTSALKEAMLAFRKKHNQIWAVMGERAGVTDFVLCYDIEKKAYTIYQFHLSNLDNLTAVHVYEAASDEIVVIAAQNHSAYIMSDWMMSDDGIPIPLLIESGEIGMLDKVERFRELYLEVINGYDASLVISGNYDRSAYVTEGINVYTRNVKGEERLIALYPEVVATYQFRIENQDVTDLKVKRFGVRYQQMDERKRINR